MIYRKEIEIKDHYDLCVAGGGFSGFACAYAAAREGLRVLLIERECALGGVGTLGLVTDILGSRYIHPDGRVTAVVGDLFTELESRLIGEGAAVDISDIDFDLNPHGWLRGLAHGLIYDKERMKLLLEQMLAEVGAEILYSTDVIDAIRVGERITSLLLHNKSGIYAVSADYFADTTGDADLARMSGCKAFKGDDDGGLSAASLEMQVENVDEAELTEYMERTGDRRFKAIIQRLIESGEWKYPYKIFISVKLTPPGVFMINTIRQTDVDGSDAYSVTRAVIDGRAESYELLSIIRRHFPGFKNATIREIAPRLGVRETYRIESEYTLTVEDLAQGREFADSIAMSSYGWDMPHPKDPNYHPSASIERKSPFAIIPYGSLVVRGVDNLIAAGRCIGVEREALGPIRVMAPCIAMGVAAGIAASLAKNGAKPFRDINVGELKRLIRSHGGITELSETHEIELKREKEN